MAEFTQTMSGDSRYSIKLTVTEVIPSDYVTTNKTNVNYTLTATKSGGSGYWNNNANNPVKVTINGTDVVNTNIAYDFRNATPKTITLASGTVTGIEHNADGSKTIAVSGYFKDNGNSLGQATASGNLTLTTIPRASQPVVYDQNDQIRVSATLGESLKIETFRASNSFTHTIQVKMGSTVVETFNNIGDEKNPWTPAISTYAPYITTGSTGTATISCTTYNGSTNLGTKTTTLNLTVPNNSTTKPTASISIAKGDSVVPSTWGVYVKGKSKLAVTITGTPKYGTTIAGYSSTANGSNYNTSTYTTNELTSAGTFNVTATVTDKRGFTSSQATSSYTVQDYSNPQITTAQVYRCDSSGNQDDSGTYIKYIFGGTISSVSSKNSKSFALRYRPKNENWTTVSGSPWTSSYTCNETAILSGFSTSTEYEFEFSATDSFTTTTLTKEIGTEPDLMNFNASGKSMAIGGVSQRTSSEKVLDIYTDAYYKGSPIAKTFMLNATNNDTAKYYKIATLKTTSDQGNGQTLRINGTIGAFYSNSKAIVDILIASRDGLNSYGTYIGNASTFDHHLFTVYKESNDRFTVYLKAGPGYKGGVFLTLTGTDIEISNSTTAITTPTGTLYSNINASNLINQNRTYSIYETRVDTWSDNKPLYRKVINFGSLPNATSKSVSTGLTNVFYTNVYGIAYNTTDGNYFPINTIRPVSGMSTSIGCYISNNNVVIETGSNRTTYNAYVVIEYTKN